MEAINRGVVLRGRRLTDGWYWGGGSKQRGRIGVEVVNGGAVLGWRWLTEGWYWGGVA